MNEPHLTLWVGEINAAESLKLGKQKIAAFRASVDALVAFGKANGLPVEDWSMFGDTRLTLDIPVGPNAVALLGAYAANPALPKIGHFVTFCFEDADAAQATALAAAAAKFGLPIEQA